MADWGPLVTLRAAYHRLNTAILHALDTYDGYVGQLAEVRSQVVALRSAAERHRNAFPPDEFVTLQTSLADMLADLDLAEHSEASFPAPSLPAPYLVAQRVKTGRRGRPRLEIDETFLGSALKLQGTTALGEVLGCHPRTVRRRALEHGLVPPHPPVRTAVVQPDGSIVYVYSGRQRPIGSMTDAELDAAIAAILRSCPWLERKMIQEHLDLQGHQVPFSRIRASCARIRRCGDQSRCGSGGAAP
ncbi:hypothetical protein OH77DRAFT_320604 [Trametes cingulata]|nr:hypothetical protein OH77DRAFT_320604 [Trametes cingulata]